MIKWWYLICVGLLVVGCVTSKQSAPQSLPPLPSISIPDLTIQELLVTNRHRITNFPPHYTFLKAWNYTSSIMVISNSYDLKTWYLYTNLNPYAFVMIIQTNKQEFFKYGN